MILGGELRIMPRKFSHASPQQREPRAARRQVPRELNHNNSYKENSDEKHEAKELFLHFRLVCV